MMFTHKVLLQLLLGKLASGSSHQGTPISECIGTLDKLKSTLKAARLKEGLDANLKLEVDNKIQFATRIRICLKACEINCRQKEDPVFMKTPLPCLKDNCYILKLRLTGFEEELAQFKEQYTKFKKERAEKRRAKRNSTLPAEMGKVIKKLRDDLNETLRKDLAAHKDNREVGIKIHIASMFIRCLKECEGLGYMKTALPSVDADADTWTSIYTGPFKKECREKKRKRDNAATNSQQGHGIDAEYSTDEQSTESDQETTTDAAEKTYNDYMAACEEFENCDANTWAQELQKEFSDFAAEAKNDAKQMAELATAQAAELANMKRENARDAPTEQNLRHMLEQNTANADAAYARWQEQHKNKNEQLDAQWEGMLNKQSNPLQKMRDVVDNEMEGPKAPKSTSEAGEDCSPWWWSLSVLPVLATVWYFFLRKAPTRYFLG